MFRTLIFFIALVCLSISLNAQTYLSADFEQGVPSGWTAESCWIFGDSSAVSSDNLKFISHSKFAAVNDDRDQNAFSVGGLITKQFDLTYAKNVILSFDLFFLAYENEDFSISIQKDNGAWEKYPKEFHGCSCWQHIYLNLSEFKGHKVKLKFDYSDGGSWNFGVGLDNVVVREAKKLEGFFYRLEPAKVRAKSKYDIEYKVGFCSIGADPLEHVEINFHGDNDFNDVNDVNYVGFFDSIELTINNLDTGLYKVTPSVLKDNNEILSSSPFSFKIFPTIPPFKQKDIDGNQFDLYETINFGNPVLFYFTATWCDDCHDNIPDLNLLKQEYPSLTIVSVFLDLNGTSDMIKKLDLKTDFPSFSFSQRGLQYYYLMSQDYEKSLPLSMLICPNRYEPEWSDIVWADNSWSPGSATAIRTYLDQCLNPTTDINEINTFDVGITPNPSDGYFTLNFDQNIKNKDVKISVFNVLSEQQSFQRNDIIQGSIGLSLNSIKGVYFVKIQIGNEVLTKKIQVY